jgi:hypothetical protein
MERETLEAICATLNENHDGAGDVYSVPEDATYIERGSQIDEFKISIGAMGAAAVLEEHNAVMVKTLYHIETDTVRMWFREIETKEVTREVTTLKGRTL